MTATPANSTIGDTVLDKDGLPAADLPLQNAHIDPFAVGYRKYLERKAEFEWFKNLVRDSVLETARSVPGFAQLEKARGFTVHEDELALQMQFGARSLGERRDARGQTMQEDGAALVYSLGANGDCAVAMYPARSPVRQRSEQMIILKSGRLAALILRDRMKRDLRDLVAYEMVSAVDGTPTTEQRLRIEWLKAVKATVPEPLQDQLKHRRFLASAVGGLGKNVLTTVASTVAKLLIPLALAFAAGIGIKIG